MTQLYLGAGAEAAFGEKPSARNSVTSASDRAAVINSVVVESAKAALRKGTAQRRQGRRQEQGQSEGPEKSQFIPVTAESHSPRGAALLANTVAAGYVKRWTNNHGATCSRR